MPGSYSGRIGLLNTTGHLITVVPGSYSGRTALLYGNLAIVPPDLPDMAAMHMPLALDNAEEKG